MSRLRWCLVLAAACIGEAWLLNGAADASGFTLSAGALVALGGILLLAMVSVQRLAALCLVALMACGQLTPEMQKHIAQCAIAYQRCVASSQTRDEYEGCRAGVDAQCIDGADGGGGK